MKTACLFVILLLASVQQTAADSYICRDEPYYRYQLQEKQGCQWVGEQSNACSQMDNENIVGDVYCPVTCNSCLQQAVVQKSTVSTKKCYEYGAVIEAFFTNLSPEHDDWIALYPYSYYYYYYAAEEDSDLADANHININNNNNNNLGEPLAWVWLCGTQDDQCKVSYGSFSFGKDVQSHGKGATSWPLDPGMYQAVLARRNTGGPYASYASSESFEIKEYGHPCPDEAEEY